MKPGHADIPDKKVCRLITLSRVLERAFRVRGKPCGIGVLMVLLDEGTVAGMVRAQRRD